MQAGRGLPHAWKEYLLALVLQSHSACLAQPGAGRQQHVSWLKGAVLRPPCSCSTLKGEFSAPHMLGACSPMGLSLVECHGSSSFSHLAPVLRGKRGSWLLLKQWPLSDSNSQDLLRWMYQAELVQADLCRTGDPRTGLRQLQQGTLQADRNRPNPSDCRHMVTNHKGTLQPLHC